MIWHKSKVMEFSNTEQLMAWRQRLAVSIDLIQPKRAFILAQISCPSKYTLKPTNHFLSSNLKTIINSNIPDRYIFLFSKNTPKTIPLHCPIDIERNRLD